MKLKYVYDKIQQIMSKLEDINFMDLNSRKKNQKLLNEAYLILDNFRDEIIREKIKNKQKRSEKDV